MGWSLIFFLFDKNHNFFFKMLKNKFILGGGVGAKWQSKGIIREGFVEIIFPIHIFLNTLKYNKFRQITDNFFFLLHIIISLKKGFSVCC